MNPFRTLVTAITLAALVCLATACSEDPAPVPEPEPAQEINKLKTTLLCEGNKGITPFTLRCEYFYLDEYNDQLVPENTVNWTLDIALEGIAQRFYSQSTGNNFFTEIDRAGEYTLTATNNDNITSMPVSVIDPPEALTIITRQVPVFISSDKHEVFERMLKASPGYEIIHADIQVHPNTALVISSVVISETHRSVNLVVELQPEEKVDKVERAWFAGNVILTEQKVSN
jgi:hypothetical protein